MTQDINSVPQLYALAERQVGVTGNGGIDVKVLDAIILTTDPHDVHSALRAGTLSRSERAYNEQIIAQESLRFDTEFKQNFGFQVAYNFPHQKNSTSAGGRIVSSLLRGREYMQPRSRRDAHTEALQHRVNKVGGRWQAAAIGLSAVAMAVGSYYVTNFLERTTPEDQQSVSSQATYTPSSRAPVETGVDIAASIAGGVVLGGSIEGGLLFGLAGGVQKLRIARVVLKSQAKLSGTPQQYTVSGE